METFFFLINIMLVFYATPLVFSLILFKEDIVRDSSLIFVAILPLLNLIACICHLDEIFTR